MSGTPMHPRDAETVRRTELQHAVAAIIAITVNANGIDFGAGGSDIVAIHSEAIGYQVIDALRVHGLTVTRVRR